MPVINFSICWDQAGFRLVIHCLQRRCHINDTLTRHVIVCNEDFDKTLSNRGYEDKLTLKIDVHRVAAAPAEVRVRCNALARVARLRLTRRTEARL